MGDSEKTNAAVLGSSFASVIAAMATMTLVGVELKQESAEMTILGFLFLFYFCLLTDYWPSSFLK